MNLNSAELEEHCQYIISCERIRGKVVVLCEGDVDLTEGIKSPTSRGKLDKMQDADFYRNCIPRWWKRTPHFFNCGDRNNVIDAYFKLLDLHQEKADISRLEPKKLFAIVDLDLQNKTISNYFFPDIESIFRDLYTQDKVNDECAKNHKIWVTGLIYKEAFFLIPDLQTVLDNHTPKLIYNNKLLQLDDIYLDMANDIINDANLKNNFAQAKSRIDYCNYLDFTDLNTLQQSWIKEFKTTNDELKKRQLIFALLKIKGLKVYWNKIETENNSQEINQYELEKGQNVLQSELIHEIARFYSKHIESNYHLTFFLKFLHQFI